VTATSSATATSNLSYSDALKKAQEIADRVALSNAQNDAAVINQSVLISIKLNGCSGCTGSGGSGGTGFTGPTGPIGPPGPPGPEGASSIYTTYCFNTIDLSKLIVNNVYNFTIGTNISYTPGQDLIFAFDGYNYFVGTIDSYDPVSGSVNIIINSIEGINIYSNWYVNLNGAQ
jgi:hypothetical protein